MDQAIGRIFRSRAIHRAANKTIAETLEQRVMLSGSSIDLLGNSPAVFVQNHGQWSDKTVDYALQSTAANVLMTDHGPVFQVFDQSTSGSKSGEEFFADFDGANTVTPTGQDRSSAEFNYYLDGKSITSVPGFEKIAYTGLYDGINLVAAGKQNSLKYEFDVAAGADASQVKVSYSGITGLSIDHLGRLHIQTKDGDLIDNAPFVYQTINGKQVQVQASFKLLDNDTYTFQLGKYDTSKALVIDPSLVWSAFLGGSDSDTGNGIAADSTGNSYVTGETSSADFPTTNGFDTIIQDTDAFVSKLDANGNLIWSTYLGGSGEDFGNAIALDANNNPYVTGETTSADFPTTGGFDKTISGFADAFVTKITSAGVLSWSSYLGGAGTDTGGGIGVDRSGVVYVDGSTSSNDFPRVSAFDTVLGGSEDGFVTAINPNVTIKWSSFLGGNDFDTINGLSVNASGVVGVAGTTESASGLATTGAVDTTLGGFQDAFAASINASAGSLTWASYIGGAGLDSGSGVAVDASGNVDVVGTTSSADFPLQPAANSTHGAFSEAFVTSVKADGTALLFSSYLGVGSATLPAGQTGGNTSGLGIALDAAGNMYIVGSTAAHNGLPQIGNGFDSVYGGGADDGFVTFITAADAIQWTSYLGGSDIDEALAVATSLSGDAFVTGFTQSSDFPALNSFDTTFNGDSDGFVARISANGGGNLPIAPQNLVAIAESFSEIDLSWSDFFNDQLGFEILRRPSTSQTYTSVAKVGAKVLTFKDTGLTPATTYYYHVRAFSVGGNGAVSNAAKATTFSAALNPPTNLTAAAFSSTQVNLSWTDNSNNETGFEIWRETVGQPSFTLVHTTGVNATSFSDTGLTPSTEYLYEVRAINTITQSPFTPAVSATTKSASFIIAPSNLIATRQPDGSVVLTWADNSDNETGFSVERAVAGSNNFTTIANTQNDITEFIDTNADANTTYLYRVNAFNNTDTSGFSNIATTDLGAALAAPSRVEAQAISSSQITITWLNTATIATSLILQRSIGSSNDFATIKRLAPTATSFTDSALLASTKYNYRLRAENSTDVSPKFSNIASDVTLSPTQTVPRAPDALKGSAISGDEIELTWHDNANNETNYTVERATSLSGPFVVIDTLGPNATSFIDKKLSTGTSFFYRVRARLGTIRSLPSGILKVSTPVAASKSAKAKKAVAPAVATSSAVFSSTPLSADQNDFLDSLG
jgi:hypothetical protein